MKYRKFRRNPPSLYTAPWIQMPPRVPPRGTGVSCEAKLPEFQRLQAIGNIYATRLYVPVRDFRVEPNAPNESDPARPNAKKKK